MNLFMLFSFVSPVLSFVRRKVEADDPTAINAMQMILGALAGSLSTTMPRTAAPTTPMPVHTAYPTLSGSVFERVRQKPEADDAAAGKQAGDKLREPPKASSYAQNVSNSPAMIKITSS